MTRFSTYGRHGRGIALAAALVITLGLAVACGDRMDVPPTPNGSNATGRSIGDTPRADATADARGEMTGNPHAGMPGMSGMSGTGGGAPMGGANPHGGGAAMGAEAWDNHPLPIETSPVDRVAILTGYLADLERMGAGADTVAQFERAYRLARQANIASDARDFGEARRLLSQVIATEPDFGPAYGVRGYIRFLTGDGEGSIGDYRRAIELDPDNGEALYSLAAGLMMRGGEPSEIDRLLDRAEEAGYPDTLGLRRMR